MFLLLMPVFAAPLEAFAAFGKLDQLLCQCRTLTNSIHGSWRTDVLPHRQVS